LSAAAGLRAAIGRAARRRPVVWDPHPRGRPPVRGVHLATPNAAEATAFSGQAGDSTLAAMAQARALASSWSARAVSVTLGERGAVLVAAGRPPLYVASSPAEGDACGAGDRFATSAARALVDGALISEAVEQAVAEAAAFVAHGGVRSLDGALPHGDHAAGGTERDPFRLAAQTRALGGTCVATGGCFDLLHAGHLHMLRAARRLGDCLVVCLNSDESVRRLKGDGRPRQVAADRAAILLALDCVDAVAVFDEPTPVEVLRRLRPHVFAKGADYDVATLPETDALAEWGGQAVALPYLSGRSTTRLLTEAAHHEP
jgi:D-beta-D-heptose 7-phosphate kinase/D-beta-D-heptose 1-phosphate adenosyltransferase